MLPVTIKSRSSSCSEYSNSYLQEIEYDSSISREIRNTVDYRFKNSLTNHSYKFPRKKVTHLDLFLNKKKRLLVKPPKLPNSSLTPLFSVKAQKSHSRDPLFPRRLNLSCSSAIVNQISALKKLGNKTFSLIKLKPLNRFIPKARINGYKYGYHRVSSIEAWGEIFIPRRRTSWKVAWPV